MTIENNNTIIPIDDIHFYVFMRKYEKLKQLVSVGKNIHDYLDISATLRHLLVTDSGLIFNVSLDKRINFITDNYLGFDKSSYEGESFLKGKLKGESIIEIINFAANNLGGVHCDLKKINDSQLKKESRRVEFLYPRLLEIGEVVVRATCDLYKMLSLGFTQSTMSLQPIYDQGLMFENNSSLRHRLSLDFRNFTVNIRITEFHSNSILRLLTFDNSNCGSIKKIFISLDRKIGRAHV